MYETHEITVNGEYAATVTVRSPIEMCTHVAAIRQVWCTPTDRYDGIDVYDEEPDIRSRIIRTFQ